MEQNTLPKPFVFVLMPFEKEFDDIYKFGIKGAAEDVGAYAERVDEQIYTEGILDRIFNQISKADVIVADMTNRNPNVFYEVGYAHALGKIVILLTQNVEDIPFDLKHKQHIIYGGRIDQLRESLKNRLHWGISEKQVHEKNFLNVEFGLYVNRLPIMHSDAGALRQNVQCLLENGFIKLNLAVVNNSTRALPPITQIYIYSKCDSFYRISNQEHWVDGSHTFNSLTEKLAWVLENDGKHSLADEMRQAATSDQKMSGTNRIDCSFNITLNNEFKYLFVLENNLPSLSPGEIAYMNIFLYPDDGTALETTLTIRLHTKERYYDFPVLLIITEKVAGLVPKNNP